MVVAKAKPTVRLAKIAVLPLFLFLGVLTYRSSLDVPLGSDARYLTVQNSFVTQPGEYLQFWTSDFFLGAETHGVPYQSGYYRPVANTLFWLEYRWAGDRAVFYNLLGVLLHGLNAFLLALLVARIARNGWAGLVAGLLFVVHPIHAFAATDPAARADVLFAAFYLGALLLFDRLLDRDRSAWPVVGLVAVSALYLLSVLSKEMGITLPAALVLLVLLRHVRSGPALRRLAWTLPAWGAFGAYLIVRFVALDLHVASMRYAESHDKLELALASLKTVPIHVSRLLVPLGPRFPELNPELVNTVGTGFGDPLVWVALGVVVALVVASLALWRTRPLAAFWCAFFGVSYSPLLRFENIGGSLDTSVILTQERWIYLPAISFFALVGAWIAGRLQLAGRDEVDGGPESATPRGAGRLLIRPISVTLAALATFLAWESSVHARKHDDPFAQLQRLYVIPEAKLGRFERANRLLLYAHWVAVPSGELEDAEARARAAIELVPDSPITARSAGGILARAGKWEEVRDLLVPWLRPDPAWLEEQHRTNPRVYDDWNRVNAEVMALMGRAAAQLGDIEAGRLYLCEARDRGIGLEALQDATREALGTVDALVCPLG